MINNKFEGIGETECCICGKTLPVDMAQIMITKGKHKYESCCCSHEGSKALKNYMLEEDSEIMESEFMKNVKVYKMNECSYVASTWDIEKTNEWYENNFDENDINEVEELDIETNGMWIETTNTADIQRLGDNDELFSYQVIDGNKIVKHQFGDLWRRYGEIYKFVGYKEVLEKDNANLEEPYEIASTEW